MFDSPEAVYYLGMSTPEPDGEYCCNVTLERDDFLEVEWMGAEYIYDGDNSSFVETPESEMFERIRLAKHYGIQTPTNAIGGSYVETYSGWVSGGTIPWNGKRHKLLKVTQIKGRNKPKLDLSDLFDDVVDGKTKLPEKKLLN